MARFITRNTRCFRGHPAPITKKKSYLNTKFGHRNYSLYVNRVLKEVVPQSGISSQTLDFMNTLINNIFERISMEACNMMYFRNRCTLTPEDIQQAVYTLFPGKLAKYAVAFGSEAVQRYVHS